MTVETGIPEVFEGTFGCGHDGEVSLENVAVTKRLARIRFLKSKGQCRECFTVSREKDRRAEDAEVGKWAREQGLPALHGTDKQLRFANTIRKNLLVSAYEALVQAGSMSEAEWTEQVQGPVELVTSAHWWIDQREVPPSGLPVALRSATEVRASAWEAAIGAAPVDGSPGQIPFARRVRFELVDAARDHFVGGSRMDAQTFRTVVEEPAARINAARWWLDQQDAPAAALSVLIEAAGNDAYAENVG